MLNIRYSVLCTDDLSMVYRDVRIRSIFCSVQERFRDLLVGAAPVPHRPRAALGALLLSNRCSPEKHLQPDLKTSRARACTNYRAARSSG